MRVGIVNGSRSTPTPTVTIQHADLRMWSHSQYITRRALPVTDISLAPRTAAAESDQSADDQIAFVSGRDSDGEIYTMRSDGTDVRQLTVNHFAVDSMPAWSP